MFIGRVNELNGLERLYKTGTFQLPVIYGRRRVGKTALINAFVQNKPCIYFTAAENNLNNNLENLSRVIYLFVNGVYSVNAPVFNSFQAALEYIFDISLQRQFVFVIDEYPYAAKADNSLSSVLQMLIDKYKDSSKLFLILCGSSMSFMEYQVLGYESPLYGRRTAQLKIEPFTFSESLPFLQNYTKQQAAYLYGIVGGTPQYLLQLKTTLSLEDNIKYNILDTFAFLYEEPVNLLKQEVRDVELYNAIIGAVAAGSTRLAEIASKVREETSACANYLKKLMSLGLIRRETPFGEKQGKKSLYFINDNLFRFWYSFVLPYSSVLQRGMVDAVYNIIQQQIDSYMGLVFEEICKQYMFEQAKLGNLPCMFVEIGRWWGTNPATKQQEEVDIVCSDGKTVTLCECKWRNELTDIKVLDKLIERGLLFNYTQKYFILFSKSGFTNACKDAASRYGNVRLISFSEMY